MVPPLSSGRDVAANEQRLPTRTPTGFPKSRNYSRHSIYPERERVKDHYLRKDRNNEKFTNATRNSKQYEKLVD